MLVATKYVCGNKTFVATNIQVFVSTKACFVAIKMTLVAARASDMPQVSEKHIFCRDKSMLAKHNFIATFLIHFFK